MRLLIPIFLWCAVVGQAADQPTFAEDVAPIIFDNCTQCHRVGQAGPFPLETYDDVRKRGAFIAAVTAARYMPPWHAGEGDVHFAGDRRLSVRQIAVLEAWVKAGMPEGDPRLAPAKPEFAEGWELGEPDVVAQMDKAFEIPADGPDIYEYFVMDIPTDRTQWMRAIEFQPGSREVVHHVLGFLVRGDEIAARRGRGFGGLTNDRNRVLTWALGTNPRLLPDDVGVRVDPGMKLLIQVHYHPTGKVERDRSRVGFHFAAEEPSRRYVEVQVPPGFGKYSGIEVPAGSDTYTLRETMQLPVAVRAFAAFGHTHYIGKEFTLDAELPSGERVRILNVPDYDFAWQEYYYFREPLDLPAGTKLHAMIRWDNTADNPSNPYSPPRDIKWGLFSEDEMGSVILDVIPVDQADEPELLRYMQRREELSLAQFYLSSDGEFFRGRRHTPGDNAGKEAWRVLERFDRDRNGRLSPGEEEAAWSFLRSEGYDAGLDRN